MAFDYDKKVKIKESMDYEMNGRLVAVANKAASLNAPVLIIGLGGTGVDSVIKVKKMIYDRLQCEVRAEEIMDKPANIEYLVIDTDRDNENKATGGIRFSDTLQECFIFTTTGFQEKLRSNRLPGYIDKWIDRTIPITEVINGAGAYRQVGRFMLFDNLRDIENTIESKIRRVTAPFHNQIPLYVFVLSGVCGGTGSGTFLDIPYIVKGISRRIDDNRVVNRIGLLFLPDVSLSQPALTTTKKENIKKNGFAALKELDYLMNVARTGDCYEQDYGMFKVGKNADGDIPPYEVCILMSTKDQKGVTVNNPYEYTMTVAAETVVNFIASEPNVDVGHFSINSFLSNESSEKSTFAALLGDDKRPINYQYAVTGASSAKLPLDDIMSYMTYLAFHEIDGLWNKIPKDSDVYDAMNSFGIDPKNMEMNLCSRAPFMQNLSRHSYDLIKQSPKMIILEFNSVLEQRKKHIDLKMEDMLQNMKKWISSDNNYITEKFKDVNFGPVFAQRLIFTTSDNLCIAKLLKEFNRFFHTNGPTANQIDGMKQLYESKLNNLLTSKPMFQGSKNKLRDEFVKACSDYYDALFKAYYYDALASICVQYHNLFIERNNEVYDCVADLLSTLVGLFGKFGGIRIENEECEIGDNKTMSWSLISTPDFIRELEKKMSRNDDLYIDLHAFVTEFYSYLFENINIWNGKEKADVVERINTFISRAFEVILNKSMDYYIDFIAKSYGLSANQFSQDVYKKLREFSTIKFPTRATYNTTVEHPAYSYVSVPINASEIKNTVKARVNDRSIIKESGILDSIFMMNFKSAMPLSAYLEIKDCHQTYANLAGSSAGLHLYEGQKYNWRNLPSPYPQSEWETGHYIQREAEENEYWRSIFDKAKKYGFIKQEIGKNSELCLKCYWGDGIDFNGILREKSVDLKRETNHSADVIACIDLINEKLSAEERRKECRAIYETRMLMLDDSSKVIDEEFAKNIFIKMVMVRNEVSRMVENTEQCLELVKTLEPYIKRRELYSKFIKIMYTETIFKQRGEYVYFDKTNAVQPFCKLQGIQNDFPEFHLYNEFFKKQFNEEKSMSEDIVRLCNRKYDEQQKSDEGYETMKDRLKNFVLKLKEIIGELNTEWRHIEDGEDIIYTYKDIYRFAEAELKGM